MTDGPIETTIQWNPSEATISDLTLSIQVDRIFAGDSVISRVHQIFNEHPELTGIHEVLRSVAKDFYELEKKVRESFFLLAGAIDRLELAAHQQALELSQNGIPHAETHPD